MANNIIAGTNCNKSNVRYITVYTKENSALKEKKMEYYKTNTIKTDRETIEKIKEEYSNTINVRDYHCYLGFKNIGEISFYDNEYGSFMSFDGDPVFPGEGIERLTKLYPDSVFEYCRNSSFNDWFYKNVVKNGKILIENELDIHNKSGIKLSTQDLQNSENAEKLADNTSNEIYIPIWYGLGLYLNPDESKPFEIDEDDMPF